MVNILQGSVLNYIVYMSSTRETKKEAQLQQIQWTWSHIDI